MMSKYIERISRQFNIGDIEAWQLGSEEEAPNWAPLKGKKLELYPPGSWFLLYKNGGCLALSDAYFKQEYQLAEAVNE